MHSPGNFVFSEKHCIPQKTLCSQKSIAFPRKLCVSCKTLAFFHKTIAFPWETLRSLEKDVWPSSAQHNEITTNQHIGLISLCCANFVVLWIVSFVLRLVSVVLSSFCCVVACFRCFATCFLRVVACFHCVVLILLCCGYFPLCWANFIVLCSVHYWAKSTSLKRNFTSFVSE